MVEASEDGRLLQIGSSEEGGDEEDVAEGVEVVGVGGVAGDGGPSVVTMHCTCSAYSSAAIGDNGGTDGAGIAEVGESSKDSHRAGGVVVSCVNERWGGGDVADGGVAGGTSVAGLERGER